MKAIVSFCAAVLVLWTWAEPAVAADPFGPYGRPAVHTRADLRRLALEAERLSDRFRESLDHALDQTIIDGTKKERKLEKRAGELENALDSVRSAVSRDDYRKARQSLKKALARANDLGRDLARLRLLAALRAEWGHLVARLDTLARFYDLQPVRRS
jgi:hypothetical protein